MEESRLSPVNGIVRKEKSARGSINKRCLVGIFFAIAGLLWGGLAHADEVYFDIASQRADRALTLFAQAADIPVLFPSHELRSITTNSLRGRYTVAEGLKVLLADTGLHVTYDKSNQLVVKFNPSSNGDATMNKSLPVKDNKPSAAVAAFLASILSVSSSGVAQGQQTDKAYVLEEVIVTAQKREQNSQDIGLSITAFSGDELRDLGMLSAQDVASQTPGLRYTLNANDDASMTFSLRGVGLDDFSAFNEAPVAIYFDEVYQATLAGNNGQLYDVERVEILKGPQGTLYGRNTTGGIVHFLSRRPTDEFEAYLDSSVGENWLHRFEGAVSGPLGETLKARLSGVYSDNEGYSEARLPGVEDSGTGGEYGARLQLLAEPNERVDLLFSTYYADANFIPTPYEHGSVTFLPDGITEVFLPPDQPNPMCPGIPGADCFGYQDRDGDPWAQDNDREKLTDLEKFGATVTINWEFDGFTFTSISAYQDVEKLYEEDSDAGPVDGIKVDDPVESRQWS